MKLEQQVCSLELAQKLKELEVKQGSLYEWVYAYHALSNKREYDIYPTDENDKVNEKFAAFTVAELGEIMGTTSEKDIVKAYGHVFNVPDTRFITATGLQDCMSRPNIGAKMLIYLLENKLITL